MRFAQNFEVERVGGRGKSAFPRSLSEAKRFVSAWSFSCVWCVSHLDSAVVCVYHTQHIITGREGMRSREVIDLIQGDGWYEVAVKGSHHHFKHPTKKGRVTVPHPKSEIAIKTLNSILKQAGLK